jgi:hypothetical protein
MRIRELLFWPGVLFAYVRAHAVFAQYLHDYKREWLVICNQYLRAARKLKESFFRTDPAFVVLPEHIAQVKDLLRAADTSHAHFEAWKRTLGLDKQMANQPSRQRLWTPLFAELVPLVRPFCRGPKHAYLQEPGTMPDQAYAVASRLMWLAHPTLWDDKPSRIKSRLQHLRDTHPIVETPLP